MEVANGAPVRAESVPDYGRKLCAIGEQPGCAAGRDHDLEGLGAFELPDQGRVQLDGINTGGPLSGGGTSGYVPDLGTAQEVSFTTSGGLGGGSPMARSRSASALCRSAADCSARSRTSRVDCNAWR